MVTTQHSCKKIVKAIQSSGISLNRKVKSHADVEGINKTSAFCVNLVSHITKDIISWNRPRDMLEGMGSLMQKKEEELALLKTKQNKESDCCL